MLFYFRRFIQLRLDVVKRIVGAWKHCSAAPNAAPTSKGTSLGRFSDAPTRDLHARSTNTKPCLACFCGSGILGNKCALIGGKFYHSYRYIM